MTKIITVSEEVYDELQERKAVTSFDSFIRGLLGMPPRKDKRKAKRMYPFHSLEVGEYVTISLKGLDEAVLKRSVKAEEKRHGKYFTYRYRPGAILIQRIS